MSGYYEDNAKYFEPQYQARTMAFDLAEESSFGGAELPMGEEKTTAQVTITYEVK